MLLFSRVVILYFLFSRCTVPRSSKKLKCKFFFVSPASFIIPSVYCLFISVLTYMYVICLSEENVRSSIYQCEVLPFSVEESHFVSLSTIQAWIVLWLLCSLLMPLAILHLIFPHWSYICKEGNSKARNSQGKFGLYQIIVEIVLDELDKERCEWTFKARTVFVSL